MMLVEWNIDDISYDFEYVHELTKLYFNSALNHSKPIMMDWILKSFIKIIKDYSLWYCIEY